MKTKLLTIAMTAALMLTAMTKVQAQNFDGPCLPPSHGLDDHQSAFCGVMQTIALLTGTTWVSFYVDVTLEDLKAVLVEAAPGTSIKITGQNNNTTYNPNTHRWLGTLTWDLSKMYMIKVTTECEITLQGDPIDPVDYPVTINEGNNWIAFPLNQSVTLTDAFAGFAVSNDKVFGQTGSATYARRWSGSLTELQPGKGYIYKAASGPRTLVFPSNAK